VLAIQVVFVGILPFFGAIQLHSTVVKNFLTSKLLFYRCAKEGFDLSEAVNFHQIVSENEMSADVRRKASNKKMNFFPGLNFHRFSSHFRG
jgi:hypothetical protein